jgi:trans-aconitate 2-methyltransferase
VTVASADWDPALYRTFEDERTRPARDLLGRVDLTSPVAIVDLGCGPGNSTELLAERFPGATLTGVDSSAAMLTEARRQLPGTEFVEGDAGRWEPSRPVDLIFANAVLQWVPDHARLLPRLFGLLRPGGVLAVQMPDNVDEPSHRLMRETAEAGPWRERIGHVGAARAKRVLPAPAYYDLLAPWAADLDIWRTTYRHPMASAAAIVQWVRATGLRPFVDPLDDGERPAFLSRYEAAIDQAYERRSDGRRLLAFPRLFIVARRAA